LTNIFNRIFYNKQLNKKGWTIRGVKTDPTQNDEDDNIDIEDVDINLVITKEKGQKDLCATIQIDGNEYSFILYDEIINYINKLRESKER